MTHICHHCGKKKNTDIYFATKKYTYLKTHGINNFHQ